MHSGQVDRAPVRADTNPARRRHSAVLSVLHLRHPMRLPSILNFQSNASAVSAAVATSTAAREIASAFPYNQASPQQDRAHSLMGSRPCEQDAAGAALQPPHGILGSTSMAHVYPATLGHQVVGAHHWNEACGPSPYITFLAETDPASMLGGAVTPQSEIDHVNSSKAVETLC